MSSIAIITDTDSSLPAEVAARYGIRHYCGTGGRCPSPSTLGRRPLGLVWTLTTPGCSPGWTMKASCRRPLHPSSPRPHTNDLPSCV